MDEVRFVLILQGKCNMKNYWMFIIKIFINISILLVDLLKYLFFNLTKWNNRLVNDFCGVHLTAFKEVLLSSYELMAGDSEGTCNRSRTWTCFWFISSTAQSSLLFAHSNILFNCYRRFLVFVIFFTAPSNGTTIICVYAVLPSRLSLAKKKLVGR